MLVYQRAWQRMRGEWGLILPEINYESWGLILMIESKEKGFTKQWGWLSLKSRNMGKREYGDLPVKTCGIWTNDWNVNGCTHRIPSIHCGSCWKYMAVCMYVWMDRGMHICMNVCLDRCMYGWMYVWMDARMHDYLYIYIHTLHYVTLRYVTLHYITSHHITLHCTHTYIRTVDYAGYMGSECYVRTIVKYAILPGTLGYGYLSFVMLILQVESTWKVMLSQWFTMVSWSLHQLNTRGSTKMRISWTIRWVTKDHCIA